MMELMGDGIDEGKYYFLLNFCTTAADFPQCPIPSRRRSKEHQNLERKPQPMSILGCRHEHMLGQRICFASKHSRFFPEQCIRPEI